MEFIGAAILFMFLHFIFFIGVAICECINPNNFLVKFLNFIYCLGNDTSFSHSLLILVVIPGIIGGFWGVYMNDREKQAIEERGRQENLEKEINDNLEYLFRKSQSQYEPLESSDFAGLHRRLSGLSDEDKIMVENQVIAPFVEGSFSSAAQWLISGTWIGCYIASRALNLVSGVFEFDAAYQAIAQQAERIITATAYNKSCALREKYGARNDKWFEDLKLLDADGRANEKFDAMHSRFLAMRSDTSLETIKQRIFFQDGNIREIKKYVTYMWYYAAEQPHDGNRFAAAVKMYQHYAGIKHTDERGEDRVLLCLDCLLATIYKNRELSRSSSSLQMTTTLIDEWTEYFIKEKDPAALSNLASGLMCIGDVKHEHELLVKMAHASVSMNESLLKRLKDLEKGDSDAPKPKDAPQPKNISSHPILGDLDVFAFDDEPRRSWADDKLIAFFDALAAQSRSINYALSVNLWEPDRGGNITIPSGFIWDDDLVFDGIIQRVMFKFGNEVWCESKQAALLLSSGHELLDGVLLKIVSSEAELNSVALFVSVFVIRGSLRLHIYTLYLPQGTAAEDRRNALQLRHSERPRQVAYINELRDTAIAAIEDIINS